MSCYRRLIVAVLGAGILSADANAQSAPRFAIEGGAAYSHYRAEDLLRGGDGVAIDAQARMNFAAFSLGVGVARARHYVKITTADFEISSIFVEPRYSFRTGSWYTLFVDGHLGRFARSMEHRPLAFDRDASHNSYMDDHKGISIGGGAGLELALGQTLRFGLASRYSHHAIEGTRLDPRDFSGRALTLRASVGLVRAPY